MVDDVNATSRVGFVPSARVDVPIAPVIQRIAHGSDPVADGKDRLTPVDERVAHVFVRARAVCDRECSAYALDARVRDAGAVVVLSGGPVIVAAPRVNGSAPAVVR